MSKRVVGAVAVVAATPLLGGCVVATSSRNGSGGGTFFFLLLPLILFFVLARSLRAVTRGRTRSNRGQEQRTQAHQSTVDPRMIRAELAVLADDVLRMETEVVLHEAARNDYESAVHRYRVAQAAIEQAGNDAHIDLTRVQRVVDEAMWAMARAKAIVQGHPPPGPPPELQNPGSRGEPAVRIADDRPAYVGAPVTFQSGWFGGGGSLLGGLMLGSMLGGFSGWAIRETSDPDGDGGDGRDARGGDGFDNADDFGL